MEDGSSRNFQTRNRLWIPATAENMEQDNSRTVAIMNGRNIASSSSAPVRSLRSLAPRRKVGGDLGARTLPRPPFVTCGHPADGRSSENQRANVDENKSPNAPVLPFMNETAESTRRRVPPPHCQSATPPPTPQTMGSGTTCGPHVTVHTSGSPLPPLTSSDEETMPAVAAAGYVITSRNKRRRRNRSDMTGTSPAQISTNHAGGMEGADCDHLGPIAPIPLNMPTHMASFHLTLPASKDAVMPAPPGCVIVNPLVATLQTTRNILSSMMRRMRLAYEQPKTSLCTRIMAEETELEALTHEESPKQPPETHAVPLCPPLSTQLLPLSNAAKKKTVHTHPDSVHILSSKEPTAYMLEKLEPLQQKSYEEHIDDEVSMQDMALVTPDRTSHDLRIAAVLVPTTVIVSPMNKNNDILHRRALTRHKPSHKVLKGGFIDTSGSASFQTNACQVLNDQCIHPDAPTLLDVPEARAMEPLLVRQLSATLLNTTLQSPRPIAPSSTQLTPLQGIHNGSAPSEQQTISNRYDALGQIPKAAHLPLMARKIGAKDSDAGSSTERNKELLAASESTLDRTPPQHPRGSDQGYSLKMEDTELHNRSHTITDADEIDQYRRLHSRSEKSGKDAAEEAFTLAMPRTLRNTPMNDSHSAIAVTGDEIRPAANATSAISSISTTYNSSGITEKIESVPLSNTMQDLKSMIRQAGAQPIKALKTLSILKMAPVLGVTSFHGQTLLKTQQRRIRAALAVQTSTAMDIAILQSGLQALMAVTVLEALADAVDHSGIHAAAAIVKAVERSRSYVPIWSATPLTTDHKAAIQFMPAWRHLKDGMDMLTKAVHQQKMADHPKLDSLANIVSGINAPHCLPIHEDGGGAGGTKEDRLRLLILAEAPAMIPLIYAAIVCRVKSAHIFSGKDFNNRYRAEPDMQDKTSRVACIISDFDSISQQGALTRLVAACRTTSGEPAEHIIFNTIICYRRPRRQQHMELVRRFASSQNADVLVLLSYTDIPPTLPGGCASTQMAYSVPTMPEPFPTAVQVIASEHFLHDHTDAARILRTLRVSFIQRNIETVESIIIDASSCIVIKRLTTMTVELEDGRPVPDMWINKMAIIGLKFERCLLIVHHDIGNNASRQSGGHTDILGSASLRKEQIKLLIGLSSRFPMKVSIIYTFGMAHLAYTIYHALCTRRGPEDDDNADQSNLSQPWLCAIETPQEHFLTRFPGINCHTAQTLLNYAGLSVRDFFNATMEDAEHLPSWIPRKAIKDTLSFAQCVYFEADENMQPLLPRDQVLAMAGDHSTNRINGHRDQQQQAHVYGTNGTNPLSTGTWSTHNDQSGTAADMHMSSMPLHHSDDRHPDRMNDRMLYMGRSRMTGPAAHTYSTGIVQEYHFPAQRQSIDDIYMYQGSTHKMQHPSHRVATSPAHGSHNMGTRSDPEPQRRFQYTHLPLQPHPMAAAARTVSQGQERYYPPRYNPTKPANGHHVQLNRSPACAHRGQQQESHLPPATTTRHPNWYRQQRSDDNLMMPQDNGRRFQPVDDFLSTTSKCVEVAHSRRESLWPPERRSGYSNRRAATLPPRSPPVRKRRSHYHTPRPY